MLGGILASLLLFSALFGVLRWKAIIFDMTAMIVLSISIIMLWIIPWGIFVIAPIALAISIVSPAGRQEWADFRKRRILTAILLVAILNIAAFYPTSIPEGPAEWGEPIATENPHAPSWPASEQYTWYYDGAVIGMLNTRTPHTFASSGQTSSTLTLGVMMGMHNERLRQSIEIINDKFPVLDLDSEFFSLFEIETESTHPYGGDEYPVASFEVKREGFDTSLASVLIVGFSNAGGELTLLSITRPITSNQDDIFEEKIVLQYINNVKE